MERGIAGPKRVYDSIHAFIKKYFAHQFPQPVSAKELIDTTRRDKKVADGKVNLILLSNLGELKIVPTAYDAQLEMDVERHLAAQRDFELVLRAPLRRPQPGLFDNSTMIRPVLLGFLAVPGWIGLFPAFIFRESVAVPILSQNPFRRTFTAPGNFHWSLYCLANHELEKWPLALPFVASWFSSGSTSRDD